MAMTTKIPANENGTKDNSDNGDDNDNHNDNDGQSINFRSAASEDIPRCFEIESASYPSDEAATLESLTNRQKHAGDYFLLCTEQQEQQKEDIIMGFVCATRCQEFTEESMSEHDPLGRLLAVHSVVVDEKYRGKGVASKMLKQYVRDVIAQEEEERQQKEDAGHTQSSLPPPIESIVFIAKQHLLGFYVRCGFRVNRPSPIVHGKELWYDLEMELPTPPKQPKNVIIRTHPRSDESWFCKTEQFKSSLSFPDEIKPHLAAHTKWVQNLREGGEVCIVSGYRVDAEGKPGGGGLMFLAATSYEEAYELVSQNDPLIVNDCVDWELNGWIPQVGDIHT